MSRNKWCGLACVAMAGTVLLVMAGTSEAQRGRGWGWGPGGYDPWGYHSGAGSVANTPAAPAYYPTEIIPESNKKAGLLLTLPDANAEVWFDSFKTKQQGKLRQYVSETLDPNSVYTYNIRARWMANGQPVEKTRKIDVRAGQQVAVDFTANANQPVSPKAAPQ